MLRRMFLEQQAGPQQIMVMTPEQIKELQEKGQIQFNPNGGPSLDEMLAQSQNTSNCQNCDGSCEGGCSCGGNH